MPNVAISGSWAGGNDGKKEHDLILWTPRKLLESESQVAFIFESLSLQDIRHVFPKFHSWLLEIPGVVLSFPFLVIVIYEIYSSVMTMKKSVKGLHTYSWMSLYESISYCYSTNMNKSTVTSFLSCLVRVCRLCTFAK